MVVIAGVFVASELFLRENIVYLLIFSIEILNFFIKIMSFSIEILSFFIEILSFSIKILVFSIKILAFSIEILSFFIEKMSFFSVFVPIPNGLGRSFLGSEGFFSLSSSLPSY